MNEQSDLYLYHYFEHSYGDPFAAITELPLDDCRRLLTAQKEAGLFHNPDIEGFLTKRYDGDKRLREAFIAHGGQPKRNAPIYFTLGEHQQWASAYDNPAYIKIPLDEFDPITVSFTYGDSFAIFDSALRGAEEYWGKIYFADEILDVIARHGFPPYVEYDFKRGIYPKDKHINHHLKYVESHVWSDEVLDKYRQKWAEGNAI